MGIQQVITATWAIKLSVAVHRLLTTCDLLWEVASECILVRFFPVKLDSILHMFKHRVLIGSENHIDGHIHEQSNKWSRKKMEMF